MLNIQNQSPWQATAWLSNSYEADLMSELQKMQKKKEQSPNDAQFIEYDLNISKAKKASRKGLALFLTRLFHTIIMMLSSAYKAEFKSLYDCIRNAKQISKLNKKLQDIADKQLNIRNELKEKLEPIQPQIEENERNIKELSQLVEDQKKLIEATNERLIELNQQINQQIKKVEPTSDIKEKTSLKNIKKIFKNFPINSNSKEILAKSLAATETEYDQEVQLSLDYNAKVVELFKQQDGLMKKNQELILQFEQHSQQLVQDFKKLKKEQEEVEDKIITLKGRVKVDICKDPLPLLKSHHLQNLETMEEELPTLKQQLDALLADSDGLNFSRPILTKQHPLQSDLLKDHPELTLTLRKKFQIFDNEIESMQKQMRISRENCEINLPKKLLIQRQLKEENPDKFNSESNSAEIKTLQTLTETIKGDIKLYKEKLNELNRSSESLNQVVRMIKDIKLKGDQNLGSLLETLLVQFDPKVIKSWECKEDGHFILKLIEPIKVWIPSPKDEKGNMTTPGGVIFEIGNNKELEMTGKLDATDHSIFFNKGFILYCKYKTDIITPSLNRLKYEKNKVLIKVNYFINKENSRDLNVLMKEWGIESKVLDTHANIRTIIESQYVRKEKEG